MAALDHFAAAGWGSFCTNKLEGSVSVRLLDELRARLALAAICGGVPDPASPTPAISTIDRAGGAPRTSVMVGDSGFRRERGAERRRAGRRRHLRTPTGGQSSYRPDAIVDRFDDLFEAVMGLRI